MRYIVKRIIAFVAASLFLNIVAAKSVQNHLFDNYFLLYSEGQSHKLDREGVYNYSTSIRAKSVGLLQSTRLTTTISVGLGLMIGGTEIEFQTQPSMVRFNDIDIDIDSLLGAKVKVQFADIIPYLNMGFYIEDHKQRLSFSANIGIKYLQVSRVSVDMNGEFGNLLEQQDGVASRLHDEITQDLEDYYLEPVINMAMIYVFG